MREFIEAWYRRIPEMERDLPVILVGDRVYTPREVYEEVVRGTKLGEVMQSKIERMASLNSYEDLRELKQVALERVKRILEDLPEDFSIVSLDGKIAKGKEIFKAIGKAAVEYEMSRVAKLIRLAGERL